MANNFGDGKVQASFGRKDELLIVTRKDAPRGALHRLKINDVAKPERAVQLIAQGQDTIVSSFWGSPSVAVIDDRYYVQYQTGGPSELRTFDAKPAPGSAPDGGSRRRALYRLEPHSGKTHQLRVHMASLGLGIVNDAFYPELLDKAPDDYSRPLQLLARGIRFIDPISGCPVEYRSGLELSEAR